MDKDLLQTAKEQFEESVAGSDYNREAAEFDIRFARLGEQWDRRIKATRIAEARPVLTVNRLPSFIRRVVNEARQAQTGIKVNAVDNGGDRHAAQVIQGLIKQIERRSNADVAYDTAIDHAVTNGFGFFRCEIDYTHQYSFDMEARIQRIANPLSVYWDVNSTAFDASDWNYAFISDFLTEDEFEARYKGKAKTSFEGGEQARRQQSVLERTIHVAEWWSRDPVKFEIVRLSDGRVLRADEMPKLARMLMEDAGLDADAVDDEELVRAAMNMLGLQETARRSVDGHEVTRRMISGDDVLEETSWPGPTIPICPVWGDEVVVDGRRHFRSMIRDAIDPQRMLNYWRSATTELVALAPKSPFILPEGGLPDDDDEKGKWGTANTVSHPYLLYNDDSVARPERVSFASLPTGALQEAQLAQDDIKAIIGIYDSSLGAQSNETSGRAIMARQREADVGTFHFVDNLNRAIRYGGQCLVDVIPSVYGMQDAIRILGEDGKEQLAKMVQDQDAPSLPNPDGKGMLYNINTGVYDVTLDAGPSHDTQRQEAREVMTELMRGNPGIAPFVFDIFARNLDFQGADELEQRAKMFMQMQMQQMGMQPGSGAPGEEQPIPGATG